jgi:hypothetical protein
MKQFTKTRFFRLVKDEKRISLSVLAKAYDDFACSLFAANTAATDKVLYHNALCYIHAELKSLQQFSGSEKKCVNPPLFKQSY